jgi:competence protein ComEA
MVVPGPLPIFWAMTTLEGRSLMRGGLILLVLSGVRLGLIQVPGEQTLLPAGDSQLDGLLAESQEVRTEEARRSAPLGPGETLDPNRIGEEDFDRLPGIGPATARILVKAREEGGGFTELEDLLRVPGIGPAKLARMGTYLDFSQGVPFPLTRNRPPGGVELPGSRVDLNRASGEDLQALPGIGPALAERIVESRQNEGPFRTPEDLLRVPGVGPITLERLRPLIKPRR